MPDCNKCIWSTRDGRCVSWECDFVSHEDARRIDWLSELAERRKAPEIVRCGECKHRDSPAYSMPCYACVDEDRYEPEEGSEDNE